MARTDPQVNFRIPAKLKEAIEAAAIAENRTVTAEIVSRLQDSFDKNSVPATKTRRNPGTESKHFELNADEIADKVVERLERKGDALPDKVVQVKIDPNEMVLPFGDLRELYLKYARLVLEAAERPVQALPSPVQKGPQRSANARKPHPK